MAATGADPSIGHGPTVEKERETIAEVARIVAGAVSGTAMPKQVHARCLDHAAVVTYPAFAATLANGRFDKCPCASRMSEKRRFADWQPLGRQRNGGFWRPNNDKRTFSQWTKP